MFLAFQVARIHDVRTIVIDVLGICQFVSLSVSVTRLNTASLCKHSWTDQGSPWGEDTWGDYSKKPKFLEHWKYHIAPTSLWYSASPCVSRQTKSPSGISSGRVRLLSSIRSSVEQVSSTRPDIWTSSVNISDSVVTMDQWRSWATRLTSSDTGMYCQLSQRMRSF